MRPRPLLLTITLALGLVAVPALHVRASGPTLMLVPTFGPPTTVDKAKGGGFPAGDGITITFDGSTVASITTGSTGAFATKYKVPDSAPPGAHTVSAFDPAGLGASATFFVQTVWLGAHFDSADSGFNPYENVLSASNVGGLSQTAEPQWGAFLHSETIVLFLEGNPDTPLVVGGSTPISSSPIDPTAVEDVFVSTDGGSVYDLNGCSGSLIWSAASVGPGPAGTPAMLNKVTMSDGSTHSIIVVCLGDGAYALDAATGVQLWKNPGPAGTPAAFGSGSKARVVLGDGSSVVELNAGTGRQVWSHATGGAVSGLGLYDVSTATATGGLNVSLRSVIAGDQAGDLYSLNPKAGALNWGDKAHGPNGSPAIADGVVYLAEGPSGTPAARTDGMLLALDAGSGAQLFAADTGDLNPQPFPPAPPTVADGHVFVGDFTGGLRIFGLP